MNDLSAEIVNISVCLRDLSEKHSLFGFVARAVNRLTKSSYRLFVMHGFFSKLTINYLLIFVNLTI